MKVCLLFNPKAGTADRIDAIRRELARKHRLTVVETTDAADLARKAAEAARGRFGAVAVAGGDGTVHTVVNGLGPAFPRTPLAVLPLGTGNDFCRTLAIPLDPEAAVKLIRRGRRRKIDVARIDGGASPYMVNAATGGFSGRVAADVTPELKQAWGPLAYLRGAAGPIASPVFYRVTIRLDGGPAEAVTALNVVVANGRFAAGGLAVAPTANPEDGLLDVVVVRAGDFFDASVVAARLMAGDYHTLDDVSHRRAKRVEIESDPPMPFSIDGELIEAAKIAFEVVPKAVRVFPGRDYRPDPKGAAVGQGRVKQALFAALAGWLWLVSRSYRWPGLGVTVAVFSLLAAAWLTRGVIAGDFAGLNERVGRAVRGWEGEPLTAAALAVTAVGDPPPAAAVAAAVALLFLAWRWYADAAGVVLTVLAVGAAELVVKPWLAVPRPDWIPPLHPALGYGYPSGHALRAAGLCSYLALVLVAGRPWAGSRWAAAVALAALAVAVCFTRVYLGVHSLTDVTAGLLIGVAVGSLCAAAAHSYRPGRDQTPAAK